MLGPKALRIGEYRLSSISGHSVENDEYELYMRTTWVPNRIPIKTIEWTGSLRRQFTNAFGMGKPNHVSHTLKSCIHLNSFIHTTFLSFSPYQIFFFPSLVLCFFRVFRWYKWRRTRSWYRQKVRTFTSLLFYIHSSSPLILFSLSRCLHITSFSFFFLFLLAYTTIVGQWKIIILWTKQCWYLGRWTRRHTKTLCIILLLKITLIEWCKMMKWEI